MNAVYCINCGHRNMNTATFCQSCGENLNALYSKDENVASFHSWPDRNKYDLFIGTNQAHYFHKWRFNNGTLEKWGFNWVVFFFGVFWFGYRKMYGWMFGILAIDILLGVLCFISAIIGLDFLAISAYISTPFLNIIFAAYANKLYFQHVRKKVKEIESQYVTTPDFVNALKYKGGTSVLGLISAIAITTFLYIGIYILIFIFAFAAAMMDLDSYYYY